MLSYLDNIGEFVIAVEFIGIAVDLMGLDRV